jgi:hypothetical protein
MLVGYHGDIGHGLSKLMSIGRIYSKDGHKHLHY